MGEIERINPQEAWKRVSESVALLVCAYRSNERFNKIHLEHAISLNEFYSRLDNLAKNQEIIFY
jgi:hypothetical protein